MLVRPRNLLFVKVQTGIQTQRSAIRKIPTFPAREVWYGTSGSQLQRGQITPAHPNASQASSPTLMRSASPNVPMVHFPDRNSSSYLISAYTTINWVDNGKVIKFADGTQFTFICCSKNKDGSQAETTSARFIASSFKECAERCSVTSGLPEVCHWTFYDVYNIDVWNFHNHDLHSVVRTVGKITRTDPTGTCRLYGTGGFATGEPSDGSLDYAYISNPLPVNSPNQLTAMCSTKCPGADGGVHRSNSRVSAISTSAEKKKKYGNLTIVLALSNELWQAP